VKRNWLSGRRVVVTRSTKQAQAVQSRLMALGAQAIAFPVIDIALPEKGAALDLAIGRLNDYDWVIFTSANAVEHFYRRWEALRQLTPAAALTGKVVAVGRATATTLQEYEFTVYLVPAEYRAEAILDEIGDVADLRILLPCADIARPTLADGLRVLGAHVDRVDAYRTVIGQPSPDAYDALRSGVDVITFASSSSVRNFLALTADVDCGSPLIACIGPVTAATARELGLQVDVIPDEYTMDGLINALQRRAT